MYEDNHPTGTEDPIRTIIESSKCLKFVIERYFHPKVICAEEGGSCGRLENTILLLSRNLEREERMMEEAGYPDLASHKKEHETILRNLETLRRTLSCGSYDNDLVFEFVSEWAENHAQEFDAPFGVFLREHVDKPVQERGH